MTDFAPVPGLDVEHRFVEAGGLRFHVAEAGEGPPLVLLHGWPQHWWMWRKVLPELARTHRCIVPDLRGLGWTDAPAGGYDKPQLAADVLALLDVLEVDRFRLMGHDWGALASMIICGIAPERVEAAVILSVPPVWETHKDPRGLVGLAHMPFLSAPFAERAVPTIAAQVFRLSRFSAEEAAPYLERLQPAERRRATVAIYRTFTTRELPGVLLGSSRRPRPPMPFRVLGGVADPVCRYAKGVELVSRAGHFLPEDRPDAVLAAARDIL